MKTLFISKNSPFESRGGIERYISNLIAYYKVTPKQKLFLMLSTSKPDYIEKKDNIIIYFTNYLLLDRDTLLNKSKVTQKAQAFSKFVSKIIDEEKIDIICAENFHTDLPAAFSLLLTIETIAHNIPLVLQMHSFAATPLQTELINQLKWDKISCVSKSVAGDCFQKGTEINFISTHYLGVNRDQFNQVKNPNFDLKKELGLSDENLIVLTASRIIKGKGNILQQKGIINLIEAFSKLAPRYPKLKLVIAIGKPPESLTNEFNLAYEMLQGYIKLHNIEDQTILKMFTLEEMPDAYKAADVFVLASENETFGQVFIESMACGLPVIGTNVGGIPEIISDLYNGYLVPPNDSSILAQKIENLLHDKSLRNKFINAGIKTVTNKFSSIDQLNNFHNDLGKMIGSASSSI